MLEAAAFPSSPHVMLSPNATNLVRVMRGGLVTVMLKTQESVRCSASTAVHVTVVDLTGNSEPLGGVHAVAIGALPPTTVAAPYTTFTGEPNGEERVWDNGHVILGGSEGAGVGAAGWPLQAAAPRTLVSRTARTWT